MIPRESAEIPDAPPPRAVARRVPTLSVSRRGEHAIAQVAHGERLANDLDPQSVQRRDLVERQHEAEHQDPMGGRKQSLFVQDRERGGGAAPAEGVVLEAYLDRGRGPVANVLIRNGSLDTGDYVVAGGAWGRVRAMTDDRGKQLAAAGPATPVEVLGLAELPAAGDVFYEVTDQRKAQEVAGSRKKPGQPGARKRFQFSKR